LNRRIQNIAVCGLGKLGGCVATALASRGFSVIGFDIDSAKVEALARGRAPVEEPGLQQLVTRSKRQLKATTDLEQAVAGSEACFFITPTPSLADGSFDNDYLMRAVRSVAEHVRSAKKKNYLFVLNSTVTPGSCDSIFKPLLEQTLGGKYGRDFGLCYNPEFIALGNVLEGLLRPDLVLIGESDLRSGTLLEHAYRKLCLNKPPIERMSLVSAELAKISVNCAVTMKISFVNQLSAVCARIPGSDPAVILKAIGKDRRIGSDYLKPGLGYGGPCFPRDNRLFQYTAEKAGVHAALAEATDRINTQVNERLLQTVLQHAHKDPIAVLGLAYKPFTSVTECSPGLWLAQELARRNRTVLAHDYAASSFPSGLAANGHLRMVSDPTDVFRKKCTTFVISCPWPQYQSLFQSADFVPKRAVIIDPWGLLKRAGLDRKAAMYLNTLV
jgi:UDPglucose 6-dehydrogenase